MLCTYIYIYAHVKHIIPNILLWKRLKTGNGGGVHVDPSRHQNIIIIIIKIIITIIIRRVGYCALQGIPGWFLKHYNIILYYNNVYDRVVTNRRGGVGAIWLRASISVVAHAARAHDV